MGRTLDSLAIGAPLLGLVLACTAAGCNQNPLPGTMLGTYSVTAQSQTNSCGLAAPNPWAFDVQMSESGPTLYWSFMDGSAPLSTTMDGTNATLVDQVEANVDGTADGGLGPCTMLRADTFQLDFATGSPPSSFSGTITYAFSIAEGADCSDQYAAAGGQYAALPCTIAYTMTASRQCGAGIR
jgi:hypothetical protein